MSDSDPLVSRIDALVRHRRSFVARVTSGPVPPGDAPPAAAGPAKSATADEDVPLLTEVIDLAEASPEEASAQLGRMPLEPLIQALAADLAHALEYRLQNDLPAVVDAALERLSDDLRTGVARITESAIRDFLGRQQQLRLPLDERRDA